MNHATLWNNVKNHLRCYRATHMHSADYAVTRCVSICLSICLSLCPSVCHTPVFCLNGYTYHQKFTISTILVFYTKLDGNTRTGTPNWGVECNGLWKNVDRYLALSRKWCKLEPWLLWKANRKPHPKLWNGTSLNGLEWPLIQISRLIFNFK